MFFAAREAVEKKARVRGRREGIEEGICTGRRAERERITRMLEENGVVLPPELARILAGDET